MAAEHPILNAISTLREDMNRRFDEMAKCRDEQSVRLRANEQAVALLEQRFNYLPCDAHEAAIRGATEYPQRAVDWKNSRVIAAGTVGVPMLLYAVIELFRDAIALWKAM